MTTIAQLEQRLEDLSGQRLAYQRAYADADTNESAAWFRRRIERIDEECERLVEEIDTLIQTEEGRSDSEAYWRELEHNDPLHEP